MDWKTMWNSTFTMIQLFILQKNDFTNFCDRCCGIYLLYVDLTITSYNRKKTVLEKYSWSDLLLKDEIHE